jgi:hypothetical protein
MARKEGINRLGTAVGGSITVFLLCRTVLGGILVGPYGRIQWVSWSWIDWTIGVGASIIFGMLGWAFVRLTGWILDGFYSSSKPEDNGE